MNKTINEEMIELKQRMDLIIQENSFSHGELSLQLMWNSRAEDPKELLVYYLKTKTNVIEFTPNEILQLKKFLNSQQLVKE